MANQNGIERDPNQHITAFLDYYLNECQNPDYAVLLTGCWGSGKSYFIRKYLAGNTCVKNFLTDAEKYRVIYVSLFGAKTRAEMDQRVFEKLHPILSSKGVKLGLSAVEIVSRMLPPASGTVVNGLSVLSKAFIESQKKQPAKKVVAVFDDVERADMPVPELLGYLNEYVEYLHIPCILVADKERWEEAKTCQEDKSTLQSLSSTQEKVIGKTFQIQTEPQEVLDSWLKDGSDCCPVGNRTRKILNEHEDLLIQILEASGKRNYRAFRHTLQDFELFIGSDSMHAIVLDEQLAQDEFCQLFIADFVCVQYAFHLGLFKINEFGEEKREERLASYLADATKPKIPLTVWENIKQCFEHINRLSTHTGDYGGRWMPIWKKWLSQNWNDSIEVQTLIRDSIWFDRQNEYQLDKIYTWFQLNDEDGKKALDAFDLALKEQKLLKPNEIFALFYRLYWYARAGALRESGPEFYDKMARYVESVKDNLEYEELSSFENIEGYDSTYKVYFEDNEKFRKVLEEALKIQKENRMKKWQDDFFTLLQSQSTEDQKRACGRIAGDFNDPEKFLLSRVDIERFLVVFQKLTSGTQNKVLNALEKRYDDVEAHPELMKEKNFLISLKEKGNVIFDSATRPLLTSVFSLFYLNRTLGKILQERFQDQKENV